jgi:hypothetical protein
MTNEVGANTVAIAVLTAALVFLGVAYWRLQNRREDAAREEKVRQLSVEARLQSLKEQMILLGVSVQPLTAAMAASLVKSLTHFHLPGDDALLAKVGPPNILTAVEEAHLIELLTERTRELGASFSPLEKNSAALLPLMIERTRLENLSLDMTQTDLALVGIPRGHE